MKKMPYGAEEGSPLPTLSLANLLEEGCPRPCIRRRSTTKPYNFGSTDSLLHHAVTFSATFTWQLLSWCLCWSEKPINVLFIMLRRNVFTRLAAAGREKKGKNKVSWGDLPIELWGEIGIRMSSRLDILRFRSVCKKLRSSLPFPTRFPLWVPPPPKAGNLFPYFITEFSIYKCRGVRGLLTFEDSDQAGKFYARHICRDKSGLRRTRRLDLEPPMISLMPSQANPYSRMSCLSTAYHLRMDLSIFGSDKEMRPRGIQALVANRFVDDIVIVSSNPGVNPSYASASDLSVVALLIENGRLALMRLGGSYENLVWDIDFCNQVFKDIVTYRGQLCTLDRQERVFLMDYNSLKMTQVSPPLDRALRAEFDAKFICVDQGY